MSTLWQKLCRRVEKRFGPPVDRDGTEQEDANLQPPFLLRYSPQLFAKEVPVLFQHDADTNRLSLKPGAEEPWRKRSKHQQVPLRSSWYYCIDCPFLREWLCSVAELFLNFKHRHPLKAQGLQVQNRSPVNAQANKKYDLLEKRTLFFLSRAT